MARRPKFIARQWATKRGRYAIILGIVPAALAVLIMVIVFFSALFDPTYSFPLNILSASFAAIVTLLVTFFAAVVVELIAFAPSILAFWRGTSTGTRALVVVLNVLGGLIIIGYFVAFLVAINVPTEAQREAARTKGAQAAAAKVLQQPQVQTAGMPQYSPDGKWWWTGYQWVAVPGATTSTPAATTPTPVATTPAARKRAPRKTQTDRPGVAATGGHRPGGGSI